MAKFSNKAAIITGASSGIGRAIAVYLAPTGLDQWLVGRDMDALRETAAMIQNAGGPAAQCIAIDIDKPGALADLVTDVGEHHPDLFALVNNAGIMHPEPILDSDPDRWRKMFETNVIAPIDAIRAAVVVMRAHGRGGRLINISSIGARTANNGMYSASKAALESAGRSLRKELENDDIRITTIVPGGFVTQLGRGFRPDTVEALAESAQQKGFDLAMPDERIIGDPVHVAKIVEYVLDLPSVINLEEVVIRPPISIDI
jgi:NADP-dependent 3-hydroxy acid dehydrogenase YdfG